MTWTNRLERVAREGYRTYRVARDVATDYGTLAASVTSIQYGGVTFLVSAVLAPAGFVVALVLIPLWPWIFVLPALLMVVSMMAAAFTAYMLFYQVPKRAGALLQNARKAGTHAFERYTQLRALAEKNGWVPGVTGNGNGRGKAPVESLRTDLV